MLDSSGLKVEEPSQSLTSQIRHLRLSLLAVNYAAGWKTKAPTLPLHATLTTRAYSALGSTLVMSGLSLSEVCSILPSKRGVAEVEDAAIDTRFSQAEIMRGSCLLRCVRVGDRFPAGVSAKGPRRDFSHAQGRQNRLHGAEKSRFLGQPISHQVLRSSNMFSATCSELQAWGDVGMFGPRKLSTLLLGAPRFGIPEFG